MNWNSNTQVKVPEFAAAVCVCVCVCVCVFKAFSRTERELGSEVERSRGHWSEADQEEMRSQQACSICTFNSGGELLLPTLAPSIRSRMLDP